MDLQILRRLTRQLLSEERAADLSGIVSRAMPLRLQRMSELYFDFPIPSTVRKSNILFIRVPRTASTSVSLQIYGHVTTHRPARFYQDSDPDFFEGAVKLAVVRNPVSRIVSAYNFLKDNGNGVTRLRKTTKGVMTKIDRFDAFLEFYVEPNRDNLLKIDPTLHRQGDYLCSAGGALIVDNLFRFEDLEPLYVFLEAHGVGSPPLHVNGLRRHEGHLSVSDLTERQIAAIESIYAADFALFGYKPVGRATV